MAAVGGLAALLLPAVGGAEAPTTTAPSPSGAESDYTATDGGEFIAALAAASADPNGPHTIVIEDHFGLPAGSNPTYTGTEDLTIEGQDFSHELDESTRFLVVETDARVTLRRLWVTEGSAGPGSGGVVDVRGNGTLEVIESVFSYSRAGQGGGAVASPDGQVVIERSLLAYNRAREGGAVAGSDVIVTSSTLGQNRAASGGAIHITGAPGAVVLVHATVAFNHGQAGANLFMSVPQREGPRVFATAIVDPRAGGANCDLDGSVVSGLSSYTDDATCGDGSTFTIGAPGSAMLGPLQGDRAVDGRIGTPTMTPDPGSPLIDAIDPATVYQGPQLGCFSFPDQRGIDRPQEGDGTPPEWCDIGAVEVDVVPPPPPSPPSASGPVAGGPSFSG